MSQQIFHNGKSDGDIHIVNEHPASLLSNLKEIKTQNERDPQSADGSFHKRDDTENKECVWDSSIPLIAYSVPQIDAEADGNQR